MKTLENNQFNINKTTMRELTPYELSSVAGAGHENKSVIITTLIVTSIITLTTAAIEQR